MPRGLRSSGYEPNHERLAPSYQLARPLPIPYRTAQPDGSPPRQASTLQGRLQRTLAQQLGIPHPEAP